MEAVLAILVALITVVGVTYCIVKPRYAIVPVLMLFPAEQIIMGYLPDFRWKYGWVTNLVVGLIAVFGVAHHFFRGENIFKGAFNKLFFAVMAFYAYILVSLFWTPAPDSAAYFLNKSWAYFFLFYAVAPLLVTDLDDLVRISVPLMVCGVVVMALMLINPNAKFINDRFTIDLGYQVGFGQLQSNPLAIADAGGILAIVSAIYRPRERRPLLTTLQWSGVLLGMVLALLSGSRGQVLAAVGVIAVLLPFATGSKSAVKVAGSLLSVGAIVSVLYFVFNKFVISAAQTRWTGEGQAQGLEARFEMLSAALSAYVTSPLYWVTGLGAAAFNAFYTIRTTDNPHWYPHNIVVEAMTEYGLIGLALLGAVLYITTKYCLRLVAIAGEDRARRTTAVLFSGIVIFQFLMSMKQGYLLGMPPLFMFCLIMGRVVKNEEAAAALAYNQALESGEFTAEVDEQPEYENSDGTPSPEAA